MEINIMIFDRIQNLCDLNGITIYALEKKTGIKHGTIQKWKEAIPSIPNLIIVADFFGVSLDYLVGRSENSLSHKDSSELTATISELIAATKQVGNATREMDSDIQDILESHGIKVSIGYQYDI